MRPGCASSACSRQPDCHLRLRAGRLLSRNASTTSRATCSSSKRRGLLEAEKEGRWVYYRLREAPEGLYAGPFPGGHGAAAGDDMVAADQARFQERMELREGAAAKWASRSATCIGGRGHGRR